MYKRQLHREPIPPRSLIQPRPPLCRLATRRLRLPCRVRAASPFGRTDEQRLLCELPRPSVRRANSPPRVLRPPPPLAVVTAPAPAALPAQKVPIPSGHDRAEHARTPLVRLPSPLTSRPPQRPTWIPSVLMLNYNSGIPSHVIRTLTGRGSNRPSPRATPPCATSFLAGRQFYQST